MRAFLIHIKTQEKNSKHICVLDRMKGKADWWEVTLEKSQGLLEAKLMSLEFIIHIEST